MKKAIVSYAKGPHLELLNIASKTFLHYGEKFGYDVHIVDEDELSQIASKHDMEDYKNRPPAWGKIPIVYHYLQDYDVILWLDADTIICKFERDLAENFLTSPGYIQALVCHQTSEGYIPNTGVWLFKNDYLPIIRLIWEQRRFINHVWWEQAAILFLMNWNIKKKEQYETLSEYGKRSLWLPFSFNVHKNDFRFKDADPDIFHVTMFRDRKVAMMEKLEIAEKNMKKP